MQKKHSVVIFGTCIEFAGAIFANWLGWNGHHFGVFSGWMYLCFAVIFIGGMISEMSFRYQD